MMIARLTLIAALMGLAPLAHAESASSAASSASSDSVGSLSNSVQGSSNSSRGQRVAQGDYKLIEVAEAPGRPGMLRLSLQAGADGDDFQLLLPRQTLQHSQLQVGEFVRVSVRDYGLAFARQDGAEPFFLALSDEGQRALQSQVVTL